MSLPTHGPAPWRSPDRPALRVVDGAQQLMLDLRYEVAPGVDAVPEIPANLRVVGGTPPAADPLTAHLPEPRGWVARLARAVAEVSVGERPPAQLTRHVARDELARLARRGLAVQRHPAARAQRGTRRLRSVRAVRVCPVAPGVLETSAVIVGGDRACAIAIRLEARGDRWVATVVDMR